MIFDSDNNQKEKSRSLCFLLLEHAAAIHKIDRRVSYYIWNHVSLKVSATFNVAGQLQGHMDRMGANV